MPHADELRAGANCIRRSCWKTAKLMRIDHLLGQRPPTYAPINSEPDNVHPQTTISRNSSIRQTFDIALYHTFGQLCTVVSLSASSVGFAHIIKAMEPLFSALASRIVLGQMMNFRVYLSLIPVVGGVMMACAGASEFSWTSFWAGMGSNALFAMRGVKSKIAMESSSDSKMSVPKNSSHDRKISDGEDSFDDNEMDVETEVSEKDHAHTPSMSPANLFAAVTCVSFILSIPIALILEGSILTEIADITTKEGAEKANQSESNGTILVNIILSGLFHYLNNEVMYIALSNVHPITLAVGNTMKRVFIIVAGVVVFSTPVSSQTAVGSTIGIGGVFVYSMMKQWYGSR